MQILVAGATRCIYVYAIGFIGWARDTLISSGRAAQYGAWRASNTYLPGVAQSYRRNSLNYSQAGLFGFLLSHQYFQRHSASPSNVLALTCTRRRYDSDLYRQGEYQPLPPRPT